MSDERKTGRFVKIEDIADDPRSAPTRAECPMCNGKGMVNVEKRLEFMAKYPEFATGRGPTEPPKDGAA